MKTHLVLRTATLAIAVSLPGVAHAQETSEETSNTMSIQQPSLAESQGTALSVLGSEEARELAEGAEGSVVSPLTVTAEQLDPAYRDINPFYGDINAFWGHINPFYRDINPFYRDINPFYRDINPFYGDINAFWGDINAFWRDIVAFDATYLSSIGDFWNATTTSWMATDAAWEAAGADLAALSVVHADLLALVAASEAQFGARVVAAEGGTFTESFAAQVFARHGIDINDPASLANWTIAQRSAFFLDWHDSLMQYSGIDQVDHWMGAVNWTPALTQIQGEGANAIVGIIDSHINANSGQSGNLVYNAGTNNTLDGHGAGVASLIVGAHDGVGVMGIAPNATLTAYNPFAADGTASWDDVAAGILALKTPSNGSLTNLLGGNRASVINLSLGEANVVASQGLADMLARPDILEFSNSTVYVVAAGNDGIAQTEDVEWSFTTTVQSLIDPTIDPVLAMVMGYPVITESESDNAVIFVGSVDPMGNISGFSNTPGDACLLDNGVCHAGNELMYNFLVAPGELLLVSDGQGGIVRRSGTSFAAPLVSGAITLIHDFWPWLANHPDETVDIIFRSARDLGAPGVDPVYGWGMLDVTAAQSPLDFNNLEFWLYQKRGKGHKSYQVNSTDLLATGVPTWWENDDVFFTMFEDIGDTYRDFLVPMSSAMYGTRNGALGEMLSMQDFVSARFTRWLESGGADSNGDGIVGLSQIGTDNRELQGGWNLRYDAIMPRYTNDGVLDMVHSAATLEDPSGKFALTLGYGEGAMALAGGEGFGMMHDYDRYTGGVNPILGFASGETFASARFNFSKNTSISLGMSENRQTADEIPGISDAERFALYQLKPHTAHAWTVDVEHQLTKNISVKGQWTRLREDEALLGTQGTIAGLLDQGTTTDAFTLSSNVNLGDGLSVDLSATGARTNAQDGQVISTAKGVTSSAGQFAINKRGVLGTSDKLRLSVAQPLTVESGDISFTSLQVVDRQTGETGPVEQTFSIATKRRITGEVLYATPIGKRAEFGLFGHYLSEGNPGEESAYIVGANIGWRF